MKLNFLTGAPKVGVTNTSEHTKLTIISSFSYLSKKTKIWLLFCNFI